MEGHSERLANGSMRKRTRSSKSVEIDDSPAESIAVKRKSSKAESTAKRHIDFNQSVKE